MGHLLRAIVLLLAGLYSTGDLLNVDAGPGRTWMAVLCLFWVGAFLWVSWLRAAPRVAWVLVVAAIVSAALSWVLLPQFPPSEDGMSAFAWPGAATIGAGAVAGRLLFLARSVSERIPPLLIAAATLLAATSDPVMRNFSLLDTSAVLVACATIAAVGIAQQHRIQAERRVAIAEERERFANELHDRIAHEVTGIVVLAQGSGALARGGPVERPLELIEQAGLRAMDHIRGIVGRSGPTPVTARAGAAGPTPGHAPVTDVAERLTAIAADFAQTTAAEVCLPAPVDCALSTECWELMHRVATESLTNVRRHAASAQHVRLHLVAGESQVTLWITDDGRGGGLGTGGGSGLRALTRAAAAVGGELSAGPAPGGGWQVRLVVPALPSAGVEAPGRVEPTRADRREDRS